MVRLIELGNFSYVIKELPDHPVEREYRLLRALEDFGLPTAEVVAAVTGVTVCCPTHCSGAKTFRVEQRLNRLHDLGFDVDERDIVGDPADGHMRYIHQSSSTGTTGSA